MKRLHSRPVRRCLALGLALLLTQGLAAPAFADGTALTPAHDETYYATLDYYGGVLDSSVVKSYKTYGSGAITDYGDYSEVTNLTDDRSPVLEEGSVTFQLGEDAPSRFYFEGKTTKPLEEFPWTLSLSYTLNGAPVLAEDLAGKTGLVEITLDAVPNPAASEYSRNNLVLTAMSMFNGDDILSLQAQGAQVQLVGNLYCVLYMVMPGEEQHFTIRVGSDDFAYSGMIFLAVPATLDQLSQIADLKEAKEKVEDSYDALQDSMDVILDSLDGMSGSLNATAKGLDQLNQARGTISAGKDKVYDSLDTALDAAGPLSDSIQPMAGHLAAAQQALTDTTALLREVNDNVQGLKPEVENTRKLLKNLQSDLDDLQDALDDLEDDDTLWEARRVADALSSDFAKLGSSMNTLGKGLSGLNRELSGLKEQMELLDSTSGNTITIQGMTIAQVKAQWTALKPLCEAYENSGSTASFQEFFLGYSLQQYNAQVEGAGGQAVTMEEFLATPTGQEAAEKAPLAAKLYGIASQSDDFDAQLGQLEKLQDALTKYGLTVNQLKKALNAGSDLAGGLSGLCTALNGSNLSGDLEELSDLLEKTFDTLDDHSGALSSSLGTLKSAAGLAQRVSDNADTALDQVQSLTDIMNTYEPEAQQALEDAKTFADSAAVGIDALVDAARTGEGLLKDSGRDLDAGAKQTLAGLSAALRQSTKGLGQTDTIRSAKDTIDALIRDEWDSHAGGENNLLLMDAGAAPVSLTDPRNEGTQSIQYVMRTQEIKADEAEPDEAAPAARGDGGTIWTRIADMFKDIWHTITGWFSR